MLHYVRDHPYSSLIVATYACLLFFCLTALLFRPLWLWKINNAITFEPRLKAQNFEFSLPLRYLLLVGFFHYHSRILDAWVRQYIGAARKNVSRLGTFEERRIFVNIQVSLDGILLDTITAADIKSTFTANRSCLLITGEGGAGKTSLACQCARWAMANSKEERLSANIMIPVLIEHNFDTETIEGKDAFIETIRGRLKAIIDEPGAVSDAMLLNLLRRKRILIIVDGLSELDEPTRKSISPSSPNFAVAALIVTSRLDEHLEEVPKTILTTHRIQGSRLSSFMELYLQRRQKRDLFDDSEYFNACSRLSSIVGDRFLTVLIAKLYAEQMIASKENPSEYLLPKNIPELMLRYLNEINRASHDRYDNRSVQLAAKVIAWECVKHTYRSGFAVKDVAVKELGGTTDAKEIIEHLESQLRIIKTVGVEQNQIRFTLDPLAEYLAGLHLLETFGENEERWHRFLNNALAQHGAPAAISGFVMATRDCCIAKESEITLPFHVIDGLTKLAGLDPNIIQAAQLAQRIRRLVFSLSVPEPEDRVAAATALMKLGSRANAAVEPLALALRDDSVSVRRAAAEALMEIGSEAKGAVPALLEALGDDDKIVRSHVSLALGNLGLEASGAIPLLIKTLYDGDILTRRSAAIALGNLKPKASDAYPALISALQDDDAVLKDYVGGAFLKILQDESAIPLLAEGVKHGDPIVRANVIGTLGNIGRMSLSALPGVTQLLIQTLKDQNKTVRRHTQSALIRILNSEDKQIISFAVSKLLEIVRDTQDGTIRQSVAVALDSLDLNVLSNQEISAVINTLSELLTDIDVEVRRNAAKTLAGYSLKPTAKYSGFHLAKTLKETTSSFVVALRDNDSLVRRYMADTLVNVGKIRDRKRAH